jgi:uncharacterized protein HemX
MTAEADPNSAADTAGRKVRSRKRAGAAARKPPRGGRLTGGLALVLAILATLVSGWAGYLVNSKRGLTDAKGRLFNVEQVAAELSAQTEQMTRDVNALRESHAALGDSVKALHEDIGRGRRVWLLAETENLLVIAQHRLAYARDAQLALEALRAADRQLGQLGDPAYQPVRKQIETEIGALEAYARLDLAGVARRFGVLAGAVDQLPLAPAAPPVDPSAPPPQPDLLREVWRDLRDLVRIRHTAEVRRPLLLPEQQYFLRENLRLMLYGAQVALLHGDPATFELNLRSAQRWLGDYYDGNAAAVRQALQEIDAALRHRTATPPDLTASLKLLRGLRERPGAT